MVPPSLVRQNRMPEQCSGFRFDSLKTRLQLAYSSYMELDGVSSRHYHCLKTQVKSNTLE
jgi:hypothetical protein